MEAILYIIASAALICIGYATRAYEEKHRPYKVLAELVLEWKELQIKDREKECSACRRRMTDAHIQPIVEIPGFLTRQAD